MSQGIMRVNTKQYTILACFEAKDSDESEHLFVNLWEMAMGLKLSLRVTRFYSTESTNSLLSH